MQNLPHLKPADLSAERSLNLQALQRCLKLNEKNESVNQEKPRNQNEQFALEYCDYACHRARKQPVLP